jgi:transposase
MKQTELLQEIRKMRFEEAYESWNKGRLTQEEAARLLGVSERSFRRYLNRYETEGEEGLLDRRLGRGSNRSAPVDEVLALQEQYRTHYQGWNARHFHSWYKREGGQRSYSWVKSHLQAAGLLAQSKRGGVHRKKRERRPLPGMLIHQDGSRHEWLQAQWHDLIVTMDDATGEHYDMRLVEEEGTASSFLGMRRVIESRGLPCAFYSDRGSHYWHTPEAGGQVDKKNPTQFGRAMKHLGIEMIAAYSPEARGRSERAFATHQGRLPKELAFKRITTLEAANRYLRET